MADQRDPWEVYSATPTSIQGPTKVPDAPKPYEVETDAAQLEGQQLENAKKRRELAQTPDAVTIDPKINADLRTDEALRAIAQARQLMSAWSTGVGGQLLSGIGGTDARDLKTTLNTVASGITLGKLSELRASSPTGASGLGALSEREGELLRDSVSGLDQFQSIEGLRSSLDAVERHYRNVLALTNGEDPRQPETQRKYGIIATNPDGGTSSVGGDGPSGPGGGAVEPGTVLSKDEYTLEADPALAGLNAEVANRIGSGKSTQEVADYIRSAGVELQPETLSRIDQWTKFIKANPSYRGVIGVSLDKRAVPMSATRQLLNEAAQSPLGTALVTSADAATGFQLPRLTGNAALGRAGVNALSQQNPISGALGSVAGGIATGAGLEAGMARLGLEGAGTLAPRLLASDAIYGAVSANGLDPESGVEGALAGAALGLGGGAAARFGVRTGAALISPSGGQAKELYDIGVKPTIGQRFGQEGVVGAAVNRAEQALRSVPGLGAAVRTAREAPREQWERGGLKMALNAIGEVLPDDIPTGGDAIKYARKAFGDVYDRARSGMQFVPDAGYQQDFGAFQQQVVNSGVLDGETRKQLGDIISNTVGSRMRGNVLAGDAFKTAVSDLGDAISRTSKPELQAALKDYRSILDAAARRNSAPEAVELMDKADRGYAMYKPMRDASAMAGSEPGRFTPTALGSVERRTKGKTNSYVEGDTVLSDYLESGRMLQDTVPDSGTAERVGTMAALGGGIHFAPTPLTVGVGAPLAALGVSTLPGVRNVVGAALAPRNSQKLRTLGDKLRQRQALIGYAGAPLALELQQ